MLGKTRADPATPGGSPGRLLGLLTRLFCLALLLGGLALAPMGCGGDDDPMLLWLPPEEMTAPSALSVAPADAEITILWADVPGAVSYNLYWSNTPGVTCATGVLIAGVTSPFVHSGLTNGLDYFYVVTAVFPMGESGESNQIGGCPIPPPPGTPQGVVAMVTAEVPNSVTIQWEPVPGATSYNLYWNTTGAVSTLDTLIPDPTSPFEHGGLLGQTAYYYVVTAIGAGGESDLSAQVTATPRGSPGGGGGGGGGGGHEEGYGNNLSVPLVFADGFGIGGAPLTGTLPPFLDYSTGLRPAATELITALPHFVPGTEYDLGGTPYYEQKSENSWQADWINATGSDVNVTVDWGDNLAAQRFTPNSVVRVETTLYQTYLGTPPTDFADPMSEYQMALLYGSQATEMQGTDTVVLTAARRHVFAVAAHLRIEKLVGPGGAVDATVPGFDAAVYERFGVDGPGGYAAEINVAGKVVYGYVWRLNQAALSEAQKLGWWRITFALDPTATVQGAPVTNRTYLQELDASDAGSAVLDTGLNLTSIEIQIETR